MFDPRDYDGEPNESNCTSEPDWWERAEAERAVAAAEQIAEPVRTALDGWLRRQPVTPRVAAIGNGLFVRVGDGKRKRRAA
jgi:hypothetical protein